MDEAMSVGLQEELIDDLTLELSSEPTFSADILKQKVVGAIREVKTARKYPSTYTTEQINNDLYSYYSNIRNLALYDYNMIGVEGQSSSSENGISRAYVDRDKMFKGVISLARF